MGSQSGQHRHVIGALHSPKKCNVTLFRTGVTVATTAIRNPFVALLLRYTPLQERYITGGIFISPL
jgi:hypothetical protein